MVIGGKMKNVLKNFTNIVLGLFIINTCFAGGGKIDLSDVDCNNLSSIKDKKKQFLAKRNCKNKVKQAYKISNLSSINSEALPKDAYSGEDKEELKSMVEKAWANKYPKDKILAIRFSMTDWKKNTNIKSNSTGLYLKDSSALAISVIVKHDATVATIFQAYLNKDHLKETIKASVSTKSSEYIVKQMLIENI